MQEEKTDRERRKMKVPLSLFAGAPPGLLLQGFRAAAAWRHRHFKKHNSPQVESNFLQQNGFSHFKQNVVRNRQQMV